MTVIHLASGNAGKLKEFQNQLAPLGLTVKAVIPSSGMPEENGLTFLENARIKALACRLENPHIATLADDSGLEVEALHGKPGIHSARFAGANASDAENVTLLLNQLSHVPIEKRTARFICQLVCFIAPYQEHRSFDKGASEEAGEFIEIQCLGTVEGHISQAPIGRNGFGYDSVFIPKSHMKTFAQMTPIQKNAISHRAEAVKNLAKKLRLLMQ